MSDKVCDYCTAYESCCPGLRKRIVELEDALKKVHDFADHGEPSSTNHNIMEITRKALAVVGNRHFSSRRGKDGKTL